MRCIECEEIELARVRDRRAGQTLPIPYEALDGFPAGRSPAHLTRRRLMQWGVAGVASVYGAHELGWDAVWESVAQAADEPEQNSLVLLYLAGGNDGLNIVMPNGNGDELASANYAAYSNARKDIGRAVGPSVAGGKVGSWALPGQGDARRLAFTNAAISTAGGGDNGDGAYGFDSLYGDGMGGTGANLAVLLRSTRSSTPSATSTTRTSGSRPATTSTTRRAGSGASSTRTATPTTRCRPSRSTRPCRSRSAR